MSRPKQPRQEPSTRLSVRDLTQDDWPILAALFGERGACGGCWCMYWRVRGGVTWEKNKGASNRRAFRGLVQSGAVHGCLAFAAGEPVGWCNLGPRGDFSKLQRSRVLRGAGLDEERDNVWAVTCFYIPAAWRRQGIATRLLLHAVDLARRSRAPALEGYPVRSDTRRVPAAFAWTGVPTLFRRAGFREVTPKGGSRLIYRKTLGRG